MVTQDYDNTAPFTLYSQFALTAKDPNRPAADPRYDNDIINGRFDRLITSELQGKGYTLQTYNEQADFIVSYDYSIRPKIDIYNISKQHGFSYGSYQRYGGVGSRTCTDISEFDQGLLLVNIHDAKTKKLVWRGTAADIISIHATPETINKQINEMVAEVLDNFPPEV